MREIALDIETTGLEFKEGHKIIEIACIELSNHIPTGKIFQTYVNPLRENSLSAKEKHGISDDFLKDKKIFKEIVPNFLNFIKESPLIAHNGSFFDIPFLNYELKVNDFNTLKNPIIDTLTIARKKFPGSPANLDALCRRFDIDLSIRKKHSALIDTKLLAKVYLELKGGKQFSMNLLKNNKPETAQTPQKEIDKKNILKFYPLEEDTILHKKMINEIKEPIWKKYNY